MDFINLQAQYRAYKKDIDANIKAVLASSQFIMGRFVEECEENLAGYCGAKYAIACSSGTDALILSLMALDVKEGDEVITSPFSFIASVEAIMLLKAKPVFVDIDENTYNLNPALLQSAITTRTKAIIPVSIFGQMPDMVAINAIAKKHSIAVIEDAAQSFGASMGNALDSSAIDSGGGAGARESHTKNAGRDSGAKDSMTKGASAKAQNMRDSRVKGAGDSVKNAKLESRGKDSIVKNAKIKSVKSCNASLLATTSFFPSKPLGCYGDGGAVFTSDKILATKLRSLLNHGQIERYKHRYVGLNARLDALQAAVLNAKLPHLDAEIAIRQEKAKIYNENLQNVITPFIARGHISAYAQYSIRTQKRASFIQKLSDLGIPTAVHYPIPLHLQEVVLSRYKRVSLPISEKICQEIVSLPFSAFLSKKDQSAVIKAVNG